ncbi:MAG: DUF6616 family protein [Anaerolineae bacterium]|jgi:hypothetical protein
MAKPIYKMWMVEPKSSWHQLSAEEKEHHLGRVREALEKVGAKSIVTVKSAWYDEQWQYFGLEEFPDVEAVRKFVDQLQEMGHYRYFRTKGLMGNEYKRS